MGAEARGNCSIPFPNLRLLPHRRRRHVLRVGRYLQHRSATAIAAELGSAKGRIDPGCGAGYWLFPGNIGCITQLRQELARRKRALPVRHIVELLYDALCGAGISCRSFRRQNGLRKTRLKRAATKTPTEPAHIRAARSAFAQVRIGFEAGCLAAGPDYFNVFASRSSLVKPVIVH